MKLVFKLTNDTDLSDNDSVYLKEGDSSKEVKLIPSGIADVRVNHPGNVFRTGKHFVYAGQSGGEESIISGSETFLYGQNYFTQPKYYTGRFVTEGSNSITLTDPSIFGDSYPQYSTVIPFVYVYSKDDDVLVKINSIVLTDNKPVVTVFTYWATTPSDDYLHFIVKHLG